MHRLVITDDFSSHSLANVPVMSSTKHLVNVAYKMRLEKLAFVKINFDNALMTKIVKDQRVSMADKISSIGGTLGLFTGFSIISIIEIVYWVWRGISRFHINAAMLNVQKVGIKFS